MNRKLLIINIVFFLLIICNLEMIGGRIVITSPIKAGQYMDRTDIEEVEIAAGSGIKEIPDYAFLGCSSLKKVTLPVGIRKIGFQAFSECSNLEDINFPSTLVDIGNNAFTYCHNLDNLKFPKRLQHIGHNAFSFCTSLKEAILPDSLRELESYAFSDCDSLRKVRLPANGHMLGELILNCCPSMIELVEPSTKVPKFECESFIFDPEDKAAYERCVLYVLENVKDKYIVSNSWQMFNKIAMCK